MREVIEYLGTNNKYKIHYAEPELRPPAYDSKYIHWLGQTVCGYGCHLTLNKQTGSKSGWTRFTNDHSKVNCKSCLKRLGPAVPEDM